MNDAPHNALPDTIPEGFEPFPQAEGFAVHILSLIHI